jgi:uncharacterized membrane protein
MLLSKTLFRLRAVLRLIWTRIVLISALALVATAVAPFLSGLLPEGMKDRIDEEAASDLLSVLSGSMLAVATFSLSVMVSAHHYAASQVTPRSHRLLRDDARTQSVLATFIGAFVYALTALSVINTGVFAGRDYLALYGMTILVLILVVVALVRWVQHLSALGSVESTTRRVEEAALAAMEERRRLPWLGGLPRDGAPPHGAIPIPATGFGHVLHVDVSRLQELAEEAGATVHLIAVPGGRVVAGRPLMLLEVDRLSIPQQDAMAATVTSGAERSFDQDPAFGIEVMSEIAQRALSPGLNDPRTAVDVVGRQLRILSLWPDRPAPEGAPRFPALRVPPLEAEELLRAAFDHVARDGAHLVEVQEAVQEALAVLAEHPSDAMRRAATRLSARCLERSDAALDLAEDRRRVRAAAPAARE